MFSKNYVAQREVLRKNPTPLFFRKQDSLNEFNSARRTGLLSNLI